MVGSDGSVTYTGGTTEQFLVKSGIPYEAFKKVVFDRLGIEPWGKLLHFTVKFNKKQLIRLKDQDGVDHLIQFNDDFAHVYVSNDDADWMARGKSNLTLPFGTGAVVCYLSCGSTEAINDRGSLISQGCNTRG